jgi:hypothetical protein
MPNYGQSRLERIYAAVETTHGVAVAAASGNALRHISVNLKPDTSLIVRPDKTGRRSQVAGAPGRKTGSFTCSHTLVPGSAAGNPPDAKAFFESLMGNAGTVVASTSVTYSPSPTDALKSLTLWRYRTPSSLIQQVGGGCFVSQARFELGGDVPTANWSGPAIYVLDSDEIADLTDGDVGKLGLTGTTFPAEPGTQTHNGDMFAGYKGLIQINGETITEFATGAVIVNNNVALRAPFGSDYATIPVAGARGASMEMRMFDSDTAGQKAIFGLAKAKTPVEVIQQVGIIAGARVEFKLRGVQLAVPDITEDGEEFSLVLAESPASSPNNATNDIEIKWF